MSITNILSESNRGTTYVTLEEVEILRNKDKENSKRREKELLDALNEKENEIVKLKKYIQELQDIIKGRAPVSGQSSICNNKINSHKINEIIETCEKLKNLVLYNIAVDVNDAVDNQVSSKISKLDEEVNIPQTLTIPVVSLNDRPVEETTPLKTKTGRGKKSNKESRVTIAEDKKNLKIIEEINKENILNLSKVTITRAGRSVKQRVPTGNKDENNDEASENVKRNTSKKRKNTKTK